MKMSADIKSESQYCAICSESLCSLESVTVNEDILVLVQYILGVDTNALQDSLICEECLEKIHQTYDFKMVCLENVQKLTTDVDIKEENVCGEKFVVCNFCRSTVKQESSKALLELPYGQVVDNLIPTEDLEKLNNPPVCESCQVSLSNMYAVRILLLTCQGYRTNHDRLDIDKPEYKNLDELLIKDISLIKSTNLNLESVNKIKEETVIYVKEEVEHNEGDTSVSEFQIKHEELDLKMDCGEGPSDVGKYRGQSSESSIIYPNEPAQFLQEDIFQNNISLNCEQYKWFDCDGQTQHQNNDETEMYKCDLCDYQTNQNEDLKAHTVIHRKEKIFKCDFCEYTTKYKSHLNRHFLIHQKDEDIKIYKCEFCGFQTKHRSSLSKHKLIHKSLDEVETFKCDLCEFTTKRNGDLKKHVNIHKNANEVPIFSCEICGHQTKYKKHLKIHLLIHKDVTETEIFQCNTCDFQTKYKASMMNHLIKHKSADEVQLFKCEICEYRTRQKKYLKPHMLTHQSDESKKFKCEKCKYRTYSKGNLTKHNIRIHQNK